MLLLASLPKHWTGAFGLRVSGVSSPMMRMLSFTPLMRTLMVSPSEMPTTSYSGPAPVPAPMPRRSPSAPSAADVLLGSLDASLELPDSWASSDVVGVDDGASLVDDVSSVGVSVLLVVEASDGDGEESSEPHPVTPSTAAERNNEQVAMRERDRSTPRTLGDATDNVGPFAGETNPSVRRVPDRAWSGDTPFPSSRHRGDGGMIAP